MDKETLILANELSKRIEKGTEFCTHLNKAMYGGRLAKVTVQSDVYQSGEVFVNEELGTAIKEAIEKYVEQQQQTLDAL